MAKRLRARFGGHFFSARPGRDGTQHRGGGWPAAVEGRLLTNNGEIVRDAAIAGLGIAWLPTFIVGAALADGRLVTVLDAYAPPPVAVHAVYTQHRQRSLAIRAYIDVLDEAFAVP